jgi:DNA-binding protein HU-beta
MAAKTEKPAAKAEKTAVETITLTQLAAKIAEEHSSSKKDVSAILNRTIELIGGHLKKGRRLRLAGLGILQVKKRAARMGRNPATGATIKIKASKKIAFRAAKDLKDSI